jgi:hypothetical protein
LLTGEVSNGPHNRRRKVPIVIGGGGGKITPGRWLRLPTVGNTKQGGKELLYQRRNGSLRNMIHNYGGRYGVHHEADLLTKIAQVAGVNINKIGNDINNKSPIPL